jgi:alpha-glucosidase
LAGVSLEQPATSYIQFHYSKKGKFSITGSFGYSAGVGIESVIVLGSSSAGGSLQSHMTAMTEKKKTIPLMGPFSMQM